MTNINHYNHFPLSFCEKKIVAPGIRDYDHEGNWKILCSF